MDRVQYDSIMHVDNYNKTSELIKHLSKVANNRTLYESYHSWRTQLTPEHFRIKYDITGANSTC